MFLCRQKLFQNLFFLLAIYFGCTVNGIESNPAPVASAGSVGTPRAKAFSTVSVSYHSWSEKMLLDYQGLSDKSSALFAGTGLHYERQFFWGRRGVNNEIGLLFGTATGGGSASTINYISPKVSYVGAQIAMKAEYRINPQLSFSMGPILIYRNVNWPTDTLPGVVVASGSDFNAGLIFELRMRLNPTWDLRQEIGAIAFNASTYWLFGIGYKL